MSTQRPKTRKRLYLINRDFQLRYAGAAIFVGLLSTVLTSTLILFPLYQFEILRIPRFLPVPILGVMVLAAMMNVALVGLLAIFVTHRLAGPMYSLVRHFRRVEEGMWYGSVRLREGDDLRYVVRNFNGMIEAISRETREDLGAVQQLRQLLQDAASDDEKKQADLNEIHSMIDRLEQRISQRLSPPQSNIAS